MVELPALCEHALLKALDVSVAFFRGAEALIAPGLRWTSQRLGSDGVVDINVGPGACRIEQDRCGEKGPLFIVGTRFLFSSESYGRAPSRFARPGRGQSFKKLWGWRAAD